MPSGAREKVLYVEVRRFVDEAAVLQSQREEFGETYFTNEGNALEDTVIESSTVKKRRFGLLGRRQVGLNTVDFIEIVARVKDQRSRTRKYKRLELGTLKETENISSGVFADRVLNAIGEWRGKEYLRVGGMSVIQLDGTVFRKSVPASDENEARFSRTQGCAISCDFVRDYRPAVQADLVPVVLG